ncbi:MAG: hypothetical protein B7X59_01710 [Polaromonas sp. 39-63-203]|uniref:DUF1631 family protein n=1 Tax=Polaromonas sp. TaxID=1869339 RepID=UPI000BC6B67C|nr:DUF1631 family protein [Polaromonas sp.]OYZ01847.1 MAG: hypothetical protein B7Y42_02980 [Polaromonas sp. 28-63-22]OYZ84666.1 MAG: hypothetical protein B7Y03_02520 [Polaromonas sp. 24-62-144]OZB01124.1 MAG: hypothetical protein B7X59_01710 [Polaromonas sp. 39-63-203]HQS31761.1 DUF1631 family protein [Polaromonas sp.]HQS89417.1 DUF1631 family protein [Polaromonas sp.]
MTTTNKKNSLLSGQARALFTERTVRILPSLAKAIQDRLSSLVDQPGGAREMQDRRDGWQAFQRNSATWIQNTTNALTRARSTPLVTSASKLPSSGSLELLGNEVMEDKIIASRLALRLLDFASWELSDLRLRIQNLDDIPELAKDDIFRPEVVARHLVEQWSAAPLSRDLWLSVQDLIQKSMAEQMLEVYHATNEFLVQQGVMADIDLRPMVRRTPSAVRTGFGGESTLEPREGADRPQAGNPGGMSGPQGDGGRFTGDRGSPSGYNSGHSGQGSGGGGDSRGSQSSSGPGARSRQRDSGPANAVSEETRMQTATTPLARARMRAQGVMGHLRRLLSDNVAGFENTRQSPASPQLAQAIVRAQRAEEASDERTVLADSRGGGMVYGQAHVDRALGALRARTTALKQAATEDSEKATIEIVALMFQSILAEERIPPVIRVWFARLQIPVLRVALSETEFFGSLQHPARRLIDRLGSCVLGFNVTVSGGAMESEVRRIVQVIEQYPETGRRVFQIVYDEFEKFLSKFLSEQTSTARVVTLAQQVEQKETMAIQYTIEMRNMLNDMPVREGIREFLFKVWAEVLAIAAMKNGPQHQETITFKRAAADLVWAASAKPNREDRARVIADLPTLLQLLRAGMSLLGLPPAAQDEHLKVISDTLADAFMSKTEGISMERIDAMAKRLANLEDYLSDDDVGDLPLDTESLVTMIGLDAADVQIITDGGSQPTDAMRSWAQELQLGTWFSLDHNGKVSLVQFAWCSDRKQLHLFASSDGRNFLIQIKRLAAYLQAGLLVPTEEEALTVRATRDALAKLDANPERLLG